MNNYETKYSSSTYTLCSTILNDFYYPSEIILKFNKIKYKNIKKKINKHDYNTINNEFDIDYQNYLNRKKKINNYNRLKSLPEYFLKLL